MKIHSQIEVAFWFGAIYGCYKAMPIEEKEALRLWEDENVGHLGTSDWPGFIKYIGQREDVEESRGGKQGFVYLIKNGRNGLIKIGFSTKPQARECTLQSEEPELNIIHIFPAKLSIEKQLHRRYELLRVRGEWFSLTESMVSEIKAQHP